MKYDKIYLLGSGKLFLDCMGWVKEWGYPYQGYDMSDKPQKMTKVQAEKKGLNYQQISAGEVYENIRKEQGRILLLSVINPCIVPEEVLEKPGLLALNCHQALLPRHKGRNAEAWAIYEGDTVTGVTWHKMKARVDQGEILIQKEIPITETTTAYQLFRQQIQAALEGFLEMMPLVLEGKEEYVPQTSGKSDFHYSWEVPNEGKFQLSWEPERISRFLRAMDYGGLSVMPKPRLVQNGTEEEIRAYKIRKLETVLPENVDRRELEILLQKEDYEICLKLAEKK